MKLRLILRASVACFCAASLPVLAQTKGAGNAPTGSQRVPLAAAAEPYTLHAGDTVDVLFRFTPEFNDEVVIGPDGHASLKSTGDLQLAGLTLAQAQQKVVLDSADKLVSPDVTVSLKDFDRPHVVVAGEVANPGRTDLRKPTTVLQAIMAAGGPKEDAAMGRVVLFRRINSEMSEVHILKLSHYGRGTLAGNDMLLQPDDAILVGHDNLESIGRFLKTANIGIYLQPISGSQIF